MAENSFGDVTLSRILRHSDVLVAIAVVSVVIMMIIPMPTFMLDILIALNISIAMAIILISMYMQNVLEFSIFPSLLLVITLFRLALNISSTRLILLLGRQFDGKIIRAFGDFVVGGNYVVGVVIFAILVVIQFIVITKGATRVAEVQARFTLDAMPGKQMSIDSDLQSGLLTEEEAKKKRKDIQREADFYGAMDGASKFVQGDAIAGIIITFINVIGGLIIGVFQRGENFTQAAQTYTLLTVGDGLVSQIPALLISVATGIIVTRAASESNLGTDITNQFMGEPKIYFIISGILSLLAFIPGLPTIPFMILAGIAFFIGYGINANIKNKEEEGPSPEEVKKMEEEKAKKSKDVSGLMQIDKMELLVGVSLIPLVMKDQGGDLLERIEYIRTNVALDLGIIVPKIRVRDYMDAKPDEYSIYIKGFEVGKGSLMIDRYLAIDLYGSEELLDGIETVDPTYGSPAIWITEEKREMAELSGYTVVDPPTIIATHLTEIINSHAHELIDMESLKEILDNVRVNYSTLVEEIEGTDIYKKGILLKVLKMLLIENISIRYMAHILETLLEYGRNTSEPNPYELTEYCRAALAPYISKKYSDKDNKIDLVMIDPRIEDIIVGNKMTHEIQGKIANNAKTIITELAKDGIITPIFLSPPSIRPNMRNILIRVSKNVVVLSENELTNDININVKKVLEL